MGKAVRLLLVASSLALAVSAASAQGVGRVEGTVTDREGVAVEGVDVVLMRDGAAVASGLTDRSGRFELRGVAPGTYGLLFSLANATARADGIEVRAGETTKADQSVVWDIGLMQSLTVYAASRQRERITDAPAAITAVDEETIRLDASTGQLPNALALVPGAELTQSGLYDFNFNVRGFNTPLNRRVQTIIDGRDPTIPFLGNPEWSTFSVMTDELQSVEVLRGPSAALYGSNTFNGIVDMRSKSPRESQGGRVRLSVGELDTFKLEGRWAGEVGRGWSLRFLGGYNESDDFSRSRNVTVEYPGLPPELIPIPEPGIEIALGSIRADKHFDSGRVLTLEGGASSLDGPVFVIGVGRSQSNADRTWTRFNLNSTRWNVMFYSNTRDSDAQPALGSGAPIFLEDENYRLEFQTNQELGRKVRLVAGANVGREEVDTADTAGMQTLISRAVEIDRSAAFAQVDIRPTEALRLVFAARFDDSDLHDSQLSPKAAIVYDFKPGHALRLGYNEAFQVGNYAEQFLQVPVGAPLDLSAIEAQLAPLLGGVPLGLGFVPLLGLGNEELEVETIRSLELGYKGVFGQRAFLTVDYYNNRMTDFITDILPGVNPNIAPYMAPAALDPMVAQIVEATLNGAIPGLTNDPLGNPLIVFSIGNTGEVDSQGVELGSTFVLPAGFMLFVNYSWFDFDIKEVQAGTEVHPNAPEHQYAIGLLHRRDKLRTSLRYRWVDDFDWANGIFVGPVPSYGVTDFSLAYDIDETWQVGLTVNNLLDDEHYEIFGGDLLGRRALGYVALSW